MYEKVDDEGNERCVPAKSAVACEMDISGRNVQKQDKWINEAEKIDGHVCVTKGWDI